ncbi:MAG: hypothetical protein ACOC2H_05835 [Spirochaetota bacterium]
MTEIIRKNFSILRHLVRLDDDHPYLVSFVISCAIVTGILFWQGPDIVFQQESATPDKLEFVDIKTLAVPKREEKKEISTETGEVAERQVTRAKGSASDQPVDLALYPSIAQPRPIGRLPKYYPKSAEDNGVEATVFVELMITAAGEVRRVDVLRVRLSKELPPDIEKDTRADFVRDTKKILLGAKFTPAIINGKKQAIIMSLPFRFRLE